MKLICISDTHEKHARLYLPEGDVLIHAGDMSSRGFKSEIDAFMGWFTVQPHPYKILIAGNHDFFFEKATEEEIQAKIPDNVIYLNDSGCEINGVHFWGSPIQPEFYNWAFNRKPGNDIKKHWDLIPNNTDVLITHGPPFGILDKTIRGKNVGCHDLLEAVNTIQPKVHVFGHIHEAFGVLETEHTTFVNASVLDQSYYLTNEAVEIEF